MYGSEKTTKPEQLAQATFIALTGDHWTSVGNHNYLGVTAHVINDKWQLHLFALGVVKTEEKHFAKACASQFLEVAKEWEIMDKVTPIGKDSAHNMMAAARSLHFEHMPCVAHIIQRVITEALHDSWFDGALAKCRHFKQSCKHSRAESSASLSWARRRVIRPGCTHALEFNSQNDKAGPTQQRLTEGNAGTAEAKCSHYLRHSACGLIPTESQPC